MEKRKPHSDDIRLVTHAGRKVWYAEHPNRRRVSLRTEDRDAALAKIAKMQARANMLKARPRNNLKRGFVYVIVVGGRYAKIGCTNDLTKRLDHIQTHNPEPAVIVAAFRGSSIVEAKMHAGLVRQRVMREWYPWTDEVRSVVSTFAADHVSAPEVEAANDACRKGNERALKKSAARAA